uniref:Peptidase S1 domain-containing protein n=1 Tax=Panagrolaimus sp. JU765 TaxID=591449 RepID=A0AC34RMT3_9BILA
MFFTNVFGEGTTVFFPFPVPELVINYPNTLFVVYLDGFNGVECSGSIVSEHYILTTAQCLKRAPNKGFTVVDNLGLAKRLKVNTFILHPDYNPTSGDNNIGLIYIEEALKKNLSVPLALDYEELPDHELKLAGFGPKKIIDSGYESMEVHHYYSSKANSCPMKLCKDLKGDENNFVCTSEAKGTDFKPKSGGPLFVNGTDDEFYVFGLQITEINAESPKSSSLPMLHIRVSKYCDWIAKSTKDEVKCRPYPGYKNSVPKEKLIGKIV